MDPYISQAEAASYVGLDVLLALDTRLQILPEADRERVGKVVRDLAEEGIPPPTESIQAALRLLPPASAWPEFVDTHAHRARIAVGMCAVLPLPPRRVLEAARRLMVDRETRWEALWDVEREDEREAARLCAQLWGEGGLSGGGGGGGIPRGAAEWIVLVVTLLLATLGTGTKWEECDVAAIASIAGVAALNHYMLHTVRADATMILPVQSLYPVTSTVVATFKQLLSTRTLAFMGARSWALASATPLISTAVGSVIAAAAMGLRWRGHKRWAALLTLTGFVFQPVLDVITVSARATPWSHLSPHSSSRGTSLSGQMNLRGMTALGEEEVARLVDNRFLQPTLERFAQFIDDVFEYLMPKKVRQVATLAATANWVMGNDPTSTRLSASLTEPMLRYVAQRLIGEGVPLAIISGFMKAMKETLQKYDNVWSSITKVITTFSYTHAMSSTWRKRYGAHFSDDYGAIESIDATIVAFAAMAFVLCEHIREHIRKPPSRPTRQELRDINAKALDRPKHGDRPPPPPAQHHTRRTESEAPALWRSGLGSGWDHVDFGSEDE